MKLNGFIERVYWKDEDIINYKWEEVLEVVIQEGHTLGYVKNQFLKMTTL